MFRTRIVNFIAAGAIALSFSPFCPAAHGQTGTIPGPEATAAVDIDAANKAFFDGRYEGAIKYCLTLAKPQAGKTGVLVPDDLADATTSSDLRKHARLCINLGMCYLGRREPEKALPWFEHAKKHLDKMGSPPSLDLADCLLGLGECHYMQGHTKGALREFSEASNLFQQKLGRLHQDTVPALEGLAGSYYMAGDYQSALPLYEQVARADLIEFGPEHPRLALSFNSLAEVHYKLNGCPSSRKLFEQSLWIFKKRCMNELLKKLETQSPQSDGTELATMQRRVRETIMGTKRPPDIARLSVELLETRDFDPNQAKLAPRPNDFYNWRLARRHVEETLFIAIDPGIEQKGLIVCLHGLGLHSKSFDDFARKITPFGYSVIALDLRGFGSFAMEKGLDKLDLNAALEDLAAAVSVFRDHHPDLPIVLLGESMGGALALQLAAKYPDNVKALISAVPSAKRFKSTSTSLMVGLKLLENKKKPIEIGKKVIEQSTGDERVRMCWLNDPGARLKLSAEELVRFQEFMNQTERHARDIKQMPVIIFQGFKDHLVKPEGTIALYGALATPHKDLVLVGDAEHLIFEEGQTPQDIVRMLAAWLDTNVKGNPAAAAAQ